MLAVDVCPLKLVSGIELSISKYKRHMLIITQCKTVHIIMTVIVITYVIIIIMDYCLIYCNCNHNCNHVCQVTVFEISYFTPAIAHARCVYLLAILT